MHTPKGIQKRSQHRRGNLRGTVDPSVMFLFALLLATLRWRLFPFFYGGLSSLGYWRLSAWTTLGVALSVVAREYVRFLSVKRIAEFHEPCSIYPFGAIHSIDWAVSTRVSQTIWSLSGILFSFVLAALMLTVASVVDSLELLLEFRRSLIHLALANVTLGVLHMMPVLPLDGGRMLWSILRRRGNLSRNSLRFCYQLGQAIVILLAAVGTYEVWNQRPTIGGWILFSAFVLWKGNRAVFQELQVKESEGWTRKPRKTEIKAPPPRDTGKS